jgi:hypothetical protein
MLDFFYQEAEYIERMKLMSEDSSDITSSEYWEKAFLPELMPPTSILPHIRQLYKYALLLI